MDLNLKVKMLRRLVESGSPTARHALEAEFDRVAEVLATGLDYEEIRDHLTLLEAIAFSLPDKTFDLLERFMDRLKEVSITYPESYSLFYRQLSEDSSSSELLLKAIDILTDLRFLRVPEIFALLLNLTTDQNEEVRRKASESLKAQASYDLRVVTSGFGVSAQEQILECIRALGEEELESFFFTLVEVVSSLLSPSMKGASATYNTVTWSSAAVPADPSVVAVRNGAIDFLQRLYQVAKSTAEKAAIVDALEEATRTHRPGGYADSMRDMIAQNTLTVLRAYKELVRVEPLPILQRIEHNAYWQFRRSISGDVELAALAVETALSEDAEYQIYRDLIGFERIPTPWRKQADPEVDAEEPEDRKLRRIEGYIESINDDTYPTWKERICRYATMVEVGDLAAFRFFHIFLERLGETKPAFAIKLVRESDDKLQAFLVPLLSGLWVSDHRSETRAIIEAWANAGKYLRQGIRLFLSSADIDEGMLLFLLERSSEAADVAALSDLVSVAIEKRGNNPQFLTGRIFVPAVAAMTCLESADWIFDSWFRRQLRKTIESLDEEGLLTVLESLLAAKSIDHQAEEVLFHIANRAPMKVQEFFVQRLQAEQQQSKYRLFDAVPFELHKLKKPLSSNVRETVTLLRRRYEGKYGSFIYREARLLKIIFDDFPPELEEELVRVASSGSQSDLEFVLSVLRNFEGGARIYDACRRIVCILPEDSELLNEVAVCLASTGVVTGEYGFAEAYASRIPVLEAWMEDEDAKVRRFAAKQIAEFQNMVVRERRRAEEEIERRKNKYGE